jgi:hypothetical protein
VSEINGTEAGQSPEPQDSVERSFETAGEVKLRVENAAGQVEIETHDAPRTEIRLDSLDPAAAELVRRARIGERASARGHEVTVEIPRARGRGRFFLGGEAAVRVWVRVPPDTELDVSTASAPVSARGRYKVANIRSASGGIAVEEITGQARIRTASGRLDLGTVGDEADVQSASGDVRIGVAASGGKVSTASGDIELGRVGKPTRVHTASGDVRLGEVLAGASVESVSGDQRIERASTGDYVLRAVSGDIVVAVAPGSLVRFDAGSMSGKVASDIEVEPSRDAVGGPSDVPELLIQAKTVSGDISVVRAVN